MENSYIKSSTNITSLTLIPFTALCVVTLLYLFLPVTSELAIFLNVEKNNISQLTTCFGIFYALGFLIWGALSDRYGRENIIFLGLLSLAIISFLIALCSNYSYLLILRCLQGFFASAFPPVILAWLTENLDDRFRKRAVSAISCAFLLAGTLGQWFGALLIKTSLNSAMLTLSAIYLLSGFILCLLMKTIKKHNNNNNNQKINTTSLINIFCQMPAVLLDKKLIRIYACALFVLMSFVGLYVFINSLKNELEIDISQLRQIATLGMLVCLFSSWIFSKFKVTIVLSTVLCVMAITLVLQCLIILGQLPFTYLLLVVHFLYVAAIALAIPSMITCSAMFSKPQTRGIAVSLYSCILFIGASLGSLLPKYLNMQIFIYAVAGVLLLTGISILGLKLDLTVKK